MRILMSENRYEPGTALLPRWIVYAYDALMNRRWLDGFLCIGFTGRYGGLRFFSRCGYPADRIFPFLHLVEPPALPPPSRTRVASAATPYQVLFVGQLIPRKRVDLLLDAMAALTDIPWRLTLVGTGELRDELQRQAAALQITDSISFVDTLDNAAVFQLMAQSDVLVLPSRFDGWGAVVSEALTSGLPVVCSDRCGASDLLVNQANGFVFRADSAADLEKGIRYTLTSPEVIKGKALRDWSDKIAGPSAADYFVDIVDHLAADAKSAKPRCPWLETRTA
ncbi:glycosyltransferase [Variovorax sp. PAMC 28711]|uniref:glycosyltransferase n=1 Tax=Variovorax sp. PAMC 28711 TaxID=1795631 RepID=UPI001F3EFF80|nr:glycosyltransferase [Variovorax sp. PAMC 28711]